MPPLPMPEEVGPFDPEGRAERIRDGWDALAETWDSWSAVVEEWFAPATTALLERLALARGARVLELAAGSGGFTRHLARAVGSEGRVIATDSGPNMVKLLARHARDAGYANVSARVMNAEHPDVNWASMDAIACRQAFMFFGDPQGALRELYRVLRPGGRIGFTVFSGPERNEFMARSLAVLAQWGRPTPTPPTRPDGPGPFSLGSPGRVESMLRDAGFQEVTTQLVPCPLRLPSAGELVRFDRDMMGDLVEDLPADVRESAWEKIEVMCRQYVGEASSGAPAELIVAGGTRPSPGPAREPTPTPGRDPARGPLA